MRTTWCARTNADWLLAGRHALPGAALTCVQTLARDQGLGKTLQAISLLWTLLRQGPDGQPVAKRVVIVCPTSLVSNWCVLPPAGALRCAADMQAHACGSSEAQLSGISRVPLLSAPRRDSECEKWLKGRVRTTPLAESTRADVIQSVTQFLLPRSMSQVRARLSAVPASCTVRCSVWSSSSAFA